MTTAFRRFHTALGVILPDWSESRAVAGHDAGQTPGQHVSSGGRRLYVQSDSSCSRRPISVKIVTIVATSIAASIAAIHGRSIKSA